MNRFLEMQIRRILLEVERSRGRGLGRGRYRDEIDKVPGALAKSNPTKLMERLGVSKIRADKEIEKLEKFVEMVTTGNDDMSKAFTDYSVERDEVNKLDGVTIKVSEISPRDGARFIKHAIFALEAANYCDFERSPFVELLEGTSKIILYFGDKSDLWGKDKKAKTQKSPPPVTNQKNKSGPGA